MSDNRNRVNARTSRREADLVEDSGSALDLETRLHEDHHQSVRLWLRLLSCTNIIASELRRRLREQFDCTLSRFDLMAQLERVPDGLSMSEISKRMMVTNAAITGLADRLVQDGHVERAGDESDRRAVRIRLTPAGRTFFLAMAHQHERWVVELFSGLSDAEKAQLRTLTGDLKAQLRR